MFVNGWTNSAGPLLLYFCCYCYAIDEIVENVMHKIYYLLCGVLRCIHLTYIAKGVGASM